MLTVAVLAGLLALASAHGQGNWMGMGGMTNQWTGMHGQFGQGTMGYNNMGSQMNLMSLIQMMMQQGGQQMGGQMNGNMGGNMGGGNMGGNMGGGQMGGNIMGGNRGNSGVMDGIMLLLLQNMLGGQRQGGQGGQGGQQGGMQGMHSDEMEMMEEMMKKNMMAEMAEMMMVYMAYKEKEGEFKESMEGLCFMVNATYAAYERRQAGLTPFSTTTDESAMALGERLEKMSDMAAMEEAINLLNNNEQQFGEYFLRIATWACMTGDAYMQAAHKMDKMDKEHNGQECK